MITEDTMRAAEEAFGTHIVEPYVGMRMKTGKKFNKTHALIYDLYKKNKDIVNNEMLLVATIWSDEGWDYNILLVDNLLKVTHPESISRRRRELHEAGLIEYSPKAMKSRETAYRSERDKASPIPPVVKAYNKLIEISRDYEQTRLV